MLTFVHHEEKLRNMKTCSLNELLTRHVGWTMVQCTQHIEPMELEKGVNASVSGEEMMIEV